MTTPEGTSANDDAGARPKRNRPGRSKPDRSGASARAAASATSGETIDESVATSVKTAYDVLADAMEHGRRSAEHFRHGEYNVRDVPGDVRYLAANVLRLARQLSATTFDVCEALLAQQPGPAGPPPPGTTPVPPFRDGGGEAGRAGSAQSTTGHSRSPQAAPHPASAATLPLCVEFADEDAAKAKTKGKHKHKPKAHTTHLTRPTTPVRPDEIYAAPLRAAPLQDSHRCAAPLVGVTFAADLVNGGLVATVDVPPGQAGGIYSGAVFSPCQDLPLGLLVVELPKPDGKQHG